MNNNNDNNNKPMDEIIQLGNKQMYTFPVNVEKYCYANARIYLGLNLFICVQVKSLKRKQTCGGAERSSLYNEFSRLLLAPGAIKEASN